MEMFRESAVIVILAIIPFIHCDAQGSLCSVNSTLDLCGMICEPSCKNPNPKFCPRIQCSIHTQGCRCDDGFVRDENTKQCVPRFQCSECPPGEALLSCGKLCQGTCAAPFEPPSCQFTRCLLASCGCDLSNGYVWNNRTKTCVRIYECNCPAYSWWKRLWNHSM